MTADYVEILGRQIKDGIIDSFDRKNEDMLEKMRLQVNEISNSQSRLTIDTKAKLVEYREEIDQFRAEFYEKATKKDLAKIREELD